MHVRHYTSFTILLYVLTARDINCLIFAGSQFVRAHGRLDAFALRLSNGLPDMVFCTLHKASPFFLAQPFEHFFVTYTIISTPTNCIALLCLQLHFFQSFFVYGMFVLVEKAIAVGVLFDRKTRGCWSVAGARGWDCLCCSALAVICISNFQCLSLRLSVLCVLIGCSFCSTGKRSDYCSIIVC